MSSLLDKMNKKMHDVGSQIKDKLNASADKISHSHTSPDGMCSDGAHSNTQHRYHSFAPQREGNELKWYVNGCSYMWAVSVAIEQAKESIWILDWWLSPELYLRRPPKRFENYRLDRMLQAAAERGVKINVIVYKEVTQALTLSSRHTKHHLEGLHTNICVFRHPDHLPDTAVLSSSFINSFKDIKLTAATAARLPGDALKAVYGSSQGTVLYWAHHEKLCLIDGNIAFMGGLDLCYGRWDTYQHAIADVHPANMDDIVFPGQDYNNARVMDFHEVYNWENNKLDRTNNSRMGWSDVSLCVRGPTVEDLKVHFAERWNFIWREKYGVKNKGRYKELDIRRTSYGVVNEGQAGAGFRDANVQAPEGAEGQRGFDGQEGERGTYTPSGGMRDQLWNKLEGGFHQLEDKYHEHKQAFYDGQYQSGPLGGAVCQLTRSCAEWSHDSAVEHSIANAYIQIISAAKHFIYIENQFFITATSPEQKPVQNLIGAAIVERIRRAARNNEAFKIFVMMPAIPAFAGDLRSDEAISTRAIMEFQYQSICRDQKRQLSIYETLSREGIDPVKYIRFYNLRSYDRINNSEALKAVETQSGVSYEDARQQYDHQVAGVPSNNLGRAPYSTYQNATSEAYGDPTPNTVSHVYMHNGPDIRSIPWTGDPHSEIKAFVSEELYIHSKLLIADDSVVVCGSANLNDRSQLGDHDSEIAIIIHDRTPVPGAPPMLAGRPNPEANAFASSLRRFIFRKHLGLVPPQNIEHPDRNAMPLEGGRGGFTNDYDWGSAEDLAVLDPLSDQFISLWDTTAHRNTLAFRRVFHPVPDDTVLNWAQYEDYYSKNFSPPKQENEAGKESPPPAKAKYELGHVVEENFPGGVHEVKEVLSQIKGTLVEMPLLFLKEEDIAQEGLGLNAFTEDVYT